MNKTDVNKRMWGEMMSIGDVLREMGVVRDENEDENEKANENVDEDG